MDTAVVLLVLAGVAVGVFMFVNGRKHKSDPAPAQPVPDIPAAAPSAPAAVAPMVVSADPALHAALTQAITALHQSVPAAVPAAPAPPPVPKPVLPPEDQAERELCEQARAFGWGSPPYQALLAKAGGSEAVLGQIMNAHFAGFQGGKTMRVTPRDWGYTWDGTRWVSPANPVGGTYDPATQRFV